MADQPVGGSWPSGCHHSRRRHIAGYTRVMTTTIALETDKGNFELAIALGIILLDHILFHHRGFALFSTTDAPGLRRLHG